LVRQLQELGVEPRGTLLVHTAFSQVKPVEGGPEGLIAALRDAIGPDGTLVMPSMRDDPDVLFDPHSTPCRGMGVVADTFWRLPGALRSDSADAFAASGPHAATITAPHRDDLPLGTDSPVGRVRDLDGQVLLLGVGHDADTTIHLGEYLAGVRYRRQTHVILLRDGKPVRVDFAEIDHCCQNFALVDGWLEAKDWQRRGRVGYAKARLAGSRHIIAVVTEQLTADPTRFLHPKGHDAECDDAWASLAG
jgi:aminoglycoside N3'-acetyltransferase